MCKFVNNTKHSRIDKCMKELCACGCGREIIIKPYHKYYGIPKYIRFHYVKTNEFKEKSKKLHSDPQSVYNSKEYREKIACGGKNRINDLEYRNKCRIAKLGNKNPNFGKIPKHLKNIHENWKKRDPKGYKNHQHEAGKKAFLSCPRISLLELKFQKILKELDIRFIPQFDYGLGFADILVEPNTILFIDGDFWHGNPMRFKNFSQKQVAQKIKDEMHNIFLRLKGYKVIRLWEYDLKDLDYAQIKELILRLINKKGYYFIPEVLEQEKK